MAHRRLLIAALALPWIAPPLPAQEVSGHIVAVPAHAPAACAARYLTVMVDLPDDAATAGYRAAAAAAWRRHGGDLVNWDGCDADLHELLAARRPAQVLFVLRPASLDIALHRRILLASTALDDDPLPDIEFGYLTAEDGDGCLALWERCDALRARAPIRGLWWEASVAELDESFRSTGTSVPIVSAAGFRPVQHFFGLRDARRDAAIDRALAALPEAAVAVFFGNGDPQGIWLFDDARNLDLARHWDYVAGRVGHDPEGEMPRLLASRFRGLQLRAPIIWSGTCHSGAVDRVFLEPDIAATFGRVEQTTVHRLTPADSLALSWLRAGAAALCVPLAANNGNSVSDEIDFALGNGASLGATLLATWRDVFLAASGRPPLPLPVPGEPAVRPERIAAVMQQGGANRILIGDPALRPFAAVADRQRSVAVRRTAQGFRVDVERAAEAVAGAWDLYGEGAEWRITARVDLGAAGVAPGSRLCVAAAAVGLDGAPLPYRLARAAIEDHDGQRWLHLQANAPQAEVMGLAVRASFDVTVESP